MTPLPRVRLHADSNDVLSRAHCWERIGSFSLPLTSSEWTAWSGCTLSTFGPGAPVADSVAASIASRPVTTATCPSAACVMTHEPTGMRAAGAALAWAGALAPSSAMAATAAVALVCALRTMIRLKLLLVSFMHWISSFPVSPGRAARL